MDLKAFAIENARLEFGVRTERMPTNLRKIREQALRMAAGLNATVEHGSCGSVYSILIDAPDGKVWTDGGCLGMRIEGRPTSGSDRIEMWLDAIDRMDAGLMDDPTPELR